MAHPLPLLNTYSPHQFALVRIGLGCYVATHVIGLIPRSWELYGPQGMLPAAHAAPFPSVLSLLTSRTELDAFLVVVLVLALTFAAGIARRATAVLLWYAWACFVSRSPYLLLPHDGYVGWMLLATSLVPGREPLSLARRADPLQMPAAIYWAAWGVVAIAYSVSGIFKLESPSWRSGEALRLVLECPFARVGWLQGALLKLPNPVLRLTTWVCLGVEILYAPLCLHRHTRRLVWTAMVGMHLAVLLVLDIASVSVAMLIVHSFTMDRRWLPAAAGMRGAVISVRRVGEGEGEQSLAPGSTT